MARELDSIEEVLSILESGHFDALVGALENEFFEVKREPWGFIASDGKIFATNLSKFEFARDVSAFANLRGGVIVVGAATKDSKTHQTKEVERIRELPDDLRPSETYEQVLGEWIHPPPEGIGIRWYPSKAAPNRGLIGIQIPNQSDASRPFLVAHYFTEAGDKLKAALGLVVRLGAITKPTPIDELHALLREGRRLDEIHQKLDTIIARTEIRPMPRQEGWICRLLAKFRSTNA